MKIRAVTVGVCGSTDWAEFRQRLRVAFAMGNQIKDVLESEGFEVQFVRLATDPFGSWIGEVDLPTLETELDMLGVPAISLGKAVSDQDLDWIQRILDASLRFSCSAVLRDPNDSPDAILPSEERARRISDIICKLDWQRGFNFCVAAGSAPDNIPFFPSACRERAVGEDFSTLIITVATENSDMMVDASIGSNGVQHFHDRLLQTMEPAFQKMEAVIMKFLEDRSKKETDENEVDAIYGGIDPSFNPCLDGKNSLVTAFENVSQRPFPSRGSLAIAAAATSALRKLQLKKKAGYVGLMLPVMEDALLAERVQQGRVGVATILQLSSVCGVGLDTVPIPMDVQTDDVVNTLLDVGALACKYNKPLSIRLLRVNGQPGEHVDLEDPRMCPAPVVDLNS